MKKKYQVFVSSTYDDLQDERATVTQCLLEMNCIPVGMEQFPASNMSQMDYIRMMLDDCDYYILILAGRYGTPDSDGIGFTEKEYNYAIEHKIPVLSFLVRDTGSLPSNKCEKTAKGRQKLESFRKKVRESGKLVKFYSSADSLRAHVATSLSACIDNFPARGWVRGDLHESEVRGNLEAKIEEYLEKRTATDAEIDALFDEKVSSKEPARLTMSGGDIPDKNYVDEEWVEKQLESI
ncbi:MAG: DUF4062 domain-containing protein [Ruminococcaceae bacterium]|nr:DUF4062 domain-containing protein [Oscillospiraceae bacterium]